MKLNKNKVLYEGSTCLTPNAKIRYIYEKELKQ